MLATPLAGCGSSAHKQTTPDPAPAPAPQQTVVAPQHDEAAQRKADAKAAQDLLAAQKFAEEAAAKQAEEDRKRTEAIERVRGSGGGPRGRGFVLS